MDEGHRRIFVAVTLAPAVREAAARVRGVVEREAHRFRWVSPENLHLTLRFLGEIRRGRVDMVVEATREAAEGMSPFSLTLAGLGAFPSLRAPRVLWVGVAEGADRLVALAGAVDTALRGRHFPGEDRPFHPHLTVARARPGGRPPDLSWLSTPAGPLVGRQDVDSVAVMESLLGPSGPTYIEVAREALRGR